MKLGGLAHQQLYNWTSKKLLSISLTSCSNLLYHAFVRGDIQRCDVVWVKIGKIEMGYANVLYSLVVARFCIVDHSNSSSKQYSIDTL